jgi:hypothetical protein
LTPVSFAYDGAYNVYDDGKTVGCTAKCSCGMGSYSYYTAYFVDACPACGGNLYFEQGAYSGPAYTSPEGLWACSWCDRDYCAQCGKIHSGEGYWLYASDPPIFDEPVKEEKEEPTHKKVNVKILGKEHTITIENKYAKALVE